VEVGDLADGVLVQQLLEARLEAWEVVGAKACYLTLELVVLLFLPAEAHLLLHQLVLQVGVVRAQGLSLLREAPPLIEKAGFLPHRPLVHRPDQLAIAPGLGLAPFGLPLELFDLCRQTFDSVAPVL